MSDLKTQALRLILNIDSELEPLEDSFEPLKAVEQSRYTRLKKLIVRAETRYYRRNHTQASPWSLVTRIVQNAVSEVQPKAVEAEVNHMYTNPWMRPYM